MTKLPEAVRTLFDGPNYAHLATLLPNGAPHSVPLWVDLEGSRIAFIADPKSRKARNVDLDPRVALSITDRKSPNVMAQVRGRAITYPRLRAVPTPGSTSVPLAIRLPFQLAFGAGLFIAGLTLLSWWAIPLLAIGLALAMDALHRTLPAGSFRAAAGLPAVVASSFFLSVGFYAASSFVPLILVGVRSVSITVAGLAVSAGSLSWTLGVWLNTMLVHRIPRSALIASSTTLMAVGIVGLASAIYGAPLVVAYATWPLAGVGMGVAFNTLTLNTMSDAPFGREGAALASRNLMNNLGIAMGTGVGGAAVAAAEAAKFGLKSGLTVTYVYAALSALVTAALARRAAKIEKIS